MKLFLGHLLNLCWVVTFVVSLCFGPALLAEESPANVAGSSANGEATKVDSQNAAGRTPKYQKRKNVDFSDQVIEGKIRRPSASLVTAGEAVKDSGLLRLRENFLDRIAVDCAEEVP